MSVIWLKNLLGFHLTDFELLQVPRPRTELTVHITIKTVQAGTVLGSLIGPAKTLLTHGEPNREHLFRSLVKGGLYGAAVGAFAGPLVSWMAMRKLTDIEVYDRVYRLRFNANILRADRLALLSASFGGALQGQRGFVLGLDTAVVGAALIGMFRK